MTAGDLSNLLLLAIPIGLFLANVLEGYRNPAPPVAPQDAPGLGEAIGAAAGAVWGLAALCWALVVVLVFLSPVLALVWLVAR